MMKLCSLVFVLVCVSSGAVLSFQLHHGSTPRHFPSRIPTTARRRCSADEGSLTSSSSLCLFMVNEDTENLVPETSFGSETVPEAQRPINEYLDMTKQPLFGWAALDSGSTGLLSRLAIVYAVTFAVVCYPIAGATYTQDGYLLQKILASNVGCLSFVGFLMIRIYSGWSYVGTRLESKVVEYEETGWYDGNVETKTPAEQKRDKFLYTENVKPIVERLQTFSLGLTGLWVASIVAFQTSASYGKPLFEQYDPKVLERLSYDEKLADVAAQNSGGKPIYCDNRYYRAIANGGQGCDR